jgi:hypothetical protein
MSMPQGHGVTLLRGPSGHAPLTLALFGECLAGQTGWEAHPTQGGQSRRFLWELRIDYRGIMTHNLTMSTDAAIATQAMQDLESLCASAAAGRSVDPVVARRVQERAAKVREELRKRGTTNVAVDLIREVRDE